MTPRGRRSSAHWWRLDVTIAFSVSLPSSATSPLDTGTPRQDETPPDPHARAAPRARNARILVRADVRGSGDRGRATAGALVRGFTDHWRSRGYGGVGGPEHGYRARLSRAPPYGARFPIPADRLRAARSASGRLHQALGRVGAAGSHHRWRWLARGGSGARLTRCACAARQPGGRQRPSRSRGEGGSRRARPACR